jgi:hypothetical protein
MKNEQHFTEDSDKPDAQSQFLIDLDLKDVKQSHADIFFSVREIINTHDPIGLIAIGAPEDEYDPEVKTIVFQLKNVYTIEQIQDLVYQEFMRWFNEKSIVGERESYLEMAKDLHHVLHFREISGE